MVEITPEGGMILAAVAPATTLGLNIPREAVGKALTEIPLPLTLSASLTEGVQRSLDNDRTVIVRIPMDEISPEGRYWRITPLHDRNGHQPNRALCRLEWAISERFGGNAGADCQRHRDRGGPGESAQDAITRFHDRSQAARDQKVTPIRQRHAMGEHWLATLPAIDVRRGCLPELRQPPLRNTR